MGANVLWIVLDATRFDHCSVNGYDRPTTPTLETLAADGVRYTSTFAAGPWTPPSHASMFTGTYPSRHGYLDGGMAMANSDRHIATLAAEAGYSTYGVVQNPKIGADTDIATGFETYLELFRLPLIPRSVAELRRYYLELWRGWLDIGRQSLRRGRAGAERLTAAAIDRWLRSHRKSSDAFFIFTNLNAPHRVYDPPAPYDEAFQRNATEQLADGNVDELAESGGYRYMADDLEVTPAEWTALIDRYDGEIAFADAIVGSIIDSLHETDMYDETLIIVTADHGNHFGEHGLVYHQFSLYDELLHVPLVVKFPEQRWAGRTVTELVSLVDLAPTAATWMDQQFPESAGTVLEPQPATDRGAIYAEYGRPIAALEVLDQTVESVPPEQWNTLDTGLQCIRTNEYKYIRAFDGEDRLFDLSDDPREERNVLGHPEYEKIVDDLRENLDARLDQHPKMRQQEVSDERVKDQLEKLGYL